MANSTLQVTYKTKKTGTGTQDLTKEMGAAKMSLADMKAGLDMAGAAFGAVKAAVQSVIDPTVEYAGQIRELQRTIGATAEESSKLIQAADDVGISAGTLQSAMEAAIKKGVKPTIAGMSDLAEQYNAIQDPIERTKFLMEKFGKSGADLGPLMALGAEGIKAAGDEAERMGLVMGQDGVDNARAYEMAMDDFNDSVLAVKLAIAQGLLPAVTGAIKQGAQYVQVWKNVFQAMGDGRMSLLDYLKASAEVVWTDKTVADLNAELTAGYADQTAAVDAATSRYQGLADQYTTSTIPATVEYSNQVQSQTQWLNDLVPAIDSTRTAGELLAAGMSGTMSEAFNTYRDAAGNTVPVIADNVGWLETMRAKQAEAEKQLALTTAQFLFQQAAAVLTKDAQLELAFSLGLIDEPSYDAAKAMQELTTKYDTNRDGSIDAKEATNDYKDAVLALQASIIGLADKTVNIRVNTVYQDQYLDAYREATGGGRASGGPVSAGTPYMVGEQGPELVIPQDNGYVVNSTDTNALLSALQSGGRGDTYHVTINAPGATANELYAMLQANDIRRRTGARS